MKIILKLDAEGAEWQLIPDLIDRGYAERIDLLLTDLIMPGGRNGVDLAREAVSLRQGLPVILSSGYTGDALDAADYAGISLLSERIKVSPTRVNITALGSGDLSATDITGGYVLKIDDPGAKNLTWTTAGGFPSAPGSVLNVDSPKADKLAPEQAAYIKAGSRDTVRSRSFTGKPCRMLRNEWTEAWETAGNPEPLGMPLQYMVSGMAVAATNKTRSRTLMAATCAELPAITAWRLLNPPRPSGEVAVSPAETSTFSMSPPSCSARATAMC